MVDFCIFTFPNADVRERSESGLSSALTDRQANKQTALETKTKDKDAAKPGSRDENLRLAAGRTGLMQDVRLERWDQEEKENNCTMNH